MKNLEQSAPKPFDLDLDVLLHPMQAFAHPRNVVNDPDLTLNEKRAILASWASDACAVEAAPALRRVPGAGRVVEVDDILQALRELDKQAEGDRDGAGLRKRRRERWLDIARARRRRPGESPAP